MSTQRNAEVTRYFNNGYEVILLERFYDIFDMSDMSWKTEFFKTFHTENYASNLIIYKIVEGLGVYETFIGLKESLTILISIYHLNFKFFWNHN